jgi:MFS family permease
MTGAQLASRVLYPRLGPRRHIALGLVGTAVSIGLLSLMTAHSSLWWARLLMFTMGLSIAQVFVPIQAAAFATISPAATGKASTMFNTMRQVGGAIGVALLTTAIVLIGPTRLVGGDEVANLTAYRIASVNALGTGSGAPDGGEGRDPPDQARLGQLAEEQAAQGRVATLVAEATPPEEVFAAVAEEVGQLFRVDLAGLFRYEPGRTAISVATWGPARNNLPLAAGGPLRGTTLARSVRRQLPA